MAAHLSILRSFALAIVLCALSPFSLAANVDIRDVLAEKLGGHVIAIAGTSFYPTSSRIQRIKVLVNSGKNSTVYFIDANLDAKSAEDKYKVIEGAQPPGLVLIPMKMKPRPSKQGPRKPGGAATGDRWPSDCEVSCGFACIEFNNVDGLSATAGCHETCVYYTCGEGQALLK